MDKATKKYHLKHRDGNAPSMMMYKSGKQEWTLEYIVDGRGKSTKGRTRKDVKLFANRMLDRQGYATDGVELN